MRVPPPFKPAFDRAAHMRRIQPDGVAAKRNASEISPRHREITFNGRHNLILWMDIAGERVVDIAQAVKMSPSSVSAIRGSPLYQTQRAVLVEKLTASTLSDVTEIIRQDAPKNLRVVMDIRDKPEEHGGDPKVRLSAAKHMSREADRVYPRKTEHVEERNIRITLDAAHLNRLAGALREVGAPIPAEVIEATDPANNPPDRPLLEGRSVEDMIDEYRAAAGRPGSPDE